VGGVIFGGRRNVYPFQLFDPATAISALTPQQEQAFDMSILISSLSAEVSKTMAASARSCWLTSPSARITNVNDYVNLRRQPDFSAPVINQVPLNERVRASRADNITVIGQERDRQSCINACQTFGANSEDGIARDRVQQCIEDNMLWYEITDARGNRTRVVNRVWLVAKTAYLIDSVAVKPAAGDRITDADAQVWEACQLPGLPAVDSDGDHWRVRTKQIV
jgi:hypothetical protein